MPKIAEIKEIDGEIWVRVGVAGQFASGLAIMSPEEIEAQRKEYSKAYDHGYADANKIRDDRDSEREYISPWVSTKDRLPEKPNKEAYEHVNCIVLYKGDFMFLPWNCEHQCWDRPDYDDWFCNATDPSHWMLIPCFPPTTQIEGGE